MEGRGVRFAAGCWFEVSGESATCVSGDSPSNNTGQEESLQRGQRFPRDFARKPRQGRQGTGCLGGTGIPGGAGAVGELHPGSRRQT